VLKKPQYDLHCVGLTFCNWYIVQPVCIMNFSRLVYLKEGLYIVMSGEVMEYSKNRGNV